MLLLPGRSGGISGSAAGSGPDASRSQARSAASPAEPSGERSSGASTKESIRATSLAVQARNLSTAPWQSNESLRVHRRLLARPAAGMAPPAGAAAVRRLAAPAGWPETYREDAREPSVAGFKSTERYIASRDLEVAVNAAVTLQRPLLVKGEPGTGKTVLALRGRPGARPSADRVAHQVHHQGAAGPVRIRRGVPPARRPAGRRARARHRQLHRPRQAVGRVRGRRAGGAADRRDRQGRYRVPQRPAAGTRSHAVLRLRDPQDGGGEAAPGGDHHLEQREGAAGRLPAPLLLPLHPLPRPRDDGADRPRALSRHPQGPDARGAERVLPDPRGAGPEEEAGHLGAAGLAEAADGRGHAARGAAQQGHPPDHPAAVRRAAEERAGRASVRAPGVPGTPRQPDVRPFHPGAAAGRPAHLHHRIPHSARRDAARRGGLQRRGFLLPGPRHAGEGRAASGPVRPGLRALLQGPGSRPMGSRCRTCRRSGCASWRRSC